MEETMADPKVGDKVGFAKPFLRSIHASATDDIWRERGEVVEIKSFGKTCPAIAYVRGFQTTSEDGLAHVNIKNIAVVGSFRFAEAEK
jgi:hypothetical protein